MMMKMLMKQMHQSLMTDDQLMIEADDSLKRLKEIQKDPDWIYISDNPCKMYKMHIGNRLLSKGELRIELPMKQILDQLADENIMKSLNRQLKQISVLYKFEAKGKQARINYMRYSGIWPVEDRDFVNVSIKQEGQNISYIATKSSLYPHPKINKVTRATCYIAGYILEKVNQSSTNLIYISDVDLSGSIPQMFKNKLSQMQASMPKQIQSVLLGHPIKYQQEDLQEQQDDQN